MGVNNGKLIHLLSEIDESELKPLIKFTKSPYHNSNKSIIHLLQKLLTYYPDFDHKKLTKEHLYHSIHPEGKAYHEGRMNLLMTNLVSVIQDFYIYQEFQKDKILQRRLKAKAYSHRNFYKKYKKEVEGVLVDLEQSPYREEEYFFQKYDVQEEIYFNIETDRSEESKSYLYGAQEALDNFYMIAKLRLAAEQITLTRRLNISAKIDFLDMILLHLREKNIDHIVLNIYYKIIMLRKGEDINISHGEVKKKLLDNLLKIEPNTQKLIYLNLVNYGVGKLNQGDKDILKELFILFKFGLNQGYSVNNNIMTASTYFNISSISMNLKEFDWSYDFIINYENFLPKEEARLTKLMTLASWHYFVGSEKNYKHFYKTLELLREVTYKKKNIFVFIRSRILWIRTAYDLLKYDLSYYLTLMDYIKSFESQLKKDKILSSEVVQRYFSFIFCIKKIIKLNRKNNRNLNDIRKLNEEIRGQKRIALKNWIYEKVEEFH